jgi:hypothetical protein
MSGQNPGNPSILVNPHALMKKCLLLPFLLLASRLPGSDFVVYGENDFYVLDSTPAPQGPKEPDRSAFFEAYKGQTNYEKAMDLENPPQWGKTVSASTHGRIQFHPVFLGGFACRITLGGLLPDHDYILTLNGNPAKPGNSLLLSAVSGNEQERYYDFKIIKTDPSGNFDGSFGIFLKPSPYEVRCYVKDTSDFKIVLYRDFFRFEVK